jgi:hypothetical protein
MEEQQQYLLSKERRLIANMANQFRSIQELTVGTSQITDGSIANADINSSAAIALSKLADITASRALVSDSNGDVSAATTTAAEIGYVNGVTSGIQSQINGKQATITGAATSIVSSDLTASRAIVSDGSGKVGVATTTSTEIGYVNGVTSAIQTQINARTKIIAFSVTQTEVVSTTDETTLYTVTIPANTIGTANLLRIAGRVSHRNDSGGNVNCTIRYKLGGTTLVTDTVSSISDAGTTRRNGDLTAHIFGTGTNTQAASASVWIGGSNATGEGTAAEDAATNLTFTITAEHSAADATVSIILKGIVIELFS